MFPRHLLAIRLSSHIVANRDKEVAQAIGRGRDVVYERASKRRVPPVAIECNVTWLGREANKCPDTGLNRGKAPPDRCRARSHRACKIACERIITARVKKDYICIGFALHDAMYNVNLHHLKLKCLHRCQLGIDRHEIVLPTYLEPVPGIEKHASIGIGERHSKVT